MHRSEFVEQTKLNPSVRRPDLVSTLAKPDKNVEKAKKRLSKRLEKTEMQAVKDVDPQQYKKLKAAARAKKEHKTHRQQNTTKKDRGGPASLSTTPWTSGRTYSPNLNSLHEEIHDFINWVQLRPEELHVRDMVFKRLEVVIRELWPGSTTCLFGSSATGLALPGGDLDVVVLDVPSHRGNIPYLRSELLRRGIAAKRDSIAITSAKVPIVRYRDVRYGVKVDVSMSMRSSIDAVEFVKSSLEEYDMIKPIVMVLKQYVKIKALNDPSQGGLSSYGLILLCLSYFQLHHERRVTADQRTNLGVALLEILQMYGFQFNFEKCYVSVNDSGHVGLKSNLVFRKGVTERTLFVQDPLVADNNVTRPFYRLDDFKESFQSAYKKLHKRLVMQQDPDNRASNLGHVLWFSEELVGKRHEFLRNYTRLCIMTLPGSSSSTSVNSTSMQYESGGGEEYQHKNMKSPQQEQEQQQQQQPNYDRSQPPSPFWSIAPQGTPQRNFNERPYQYDTPTRGQQYDMPMFNSPVGFGTPQEMYSRPPQRIVHAPQYPSLPVPQGMGFHGPQFSQQNGRYNERFFTPPQQHHRPQHYQGNFPSNGRPPLFHS